MDQTSIISIIIGLGLAASVGFRVFLPLLALSVAAHFNIIPLNESWSWAGSVPAMIAFGTATLLEIVGYYVPWLDNLLDTIAVPTATIAGTGVMASTAMDLDPLVKWALAIIAGGGTAGLIKGTGAKTRLTSSATTGGIANPLVSTGETVASLGLSALSIFVWPVALVFVIAILVGIFFFLKKLRSLWRGVWASSEG